MRPDQTRLRVAARRTADADLIPPAEGLVQRVNGNPGLLWRKISDKKGQSINLSNQIPFNALLLHSFVAMGDSCSKICGSLLLPLRLILLICQIRVNTAHLAA